MVYLPKFRSVTTEQKLLKDILSSNQKSLNGAIFPIESNDMRLGNYSIIGMSKKYVYKLIAGKRYVNYFVYPSTEEANAIISDYNVYTKHLKKAKIKMPKLISIDKIKMSPGRYTILEIQKNEQKKDILSLMRSTSDNKRILKEYCYILEDLGKIFKYNKENKFRNKISIDTTPQNYLEGGIYIDFLPAKIKLGTEYRKHKPIEDTDEYSYYKLKWHYDNGHCILYLIFNFSLIRPDLTEEFLAKAMEYHPNTLNKILKSIDDSNLVNSMYLTAKNYGKLNINIDKSIDEVERKILDYKASIL